MCLPALFALFLSTLPFVVSLLSACSARQSRQVVLSSSHAYPPSILCMIHVLNIPSSPLFLSPCFITHTQRTCPALPPARVLSVFPCCCRPPLPAPLVHMHLNYISTCSRLLTPSCGPVPTPKKPTLVWFAVTFPGLPHALHLLLSPHPCPPQPWMCLPPTAQVFLAALNVREVGRRASECRVSRCFSRALCV